MQSVFKKVGCQKRKTPHLLIYLDITAYIKGKHVVIMVVLLFTYLKNLIMKLLLIIMIQLLLKKIIKVSGKFITKPIILGSLYGQPKTLLQNYVDFINELIHILTNLEKQNLDVIIADYNIDLLKIREKDILMTFLSVLYPQVFSPKSLYPQDFVDVEEH